MDQVWKILGVLIAALTLAACGCTISRAAPPDRPILDVDALTDQQCWELLGYMDQMQEWQTRGEIPPEPEPPEWLKKYLGPNPEKNTAQLAGLAATVPVVESLPMDDNTTSTPPDVASKPQKQSRPWVNAYINAHGCPGCDRLKQWLNANPNALPFDVHLKESGIPAFVTAVPTFHWNAPSGKSYLHEGWGGPDALLLKWKETQGYAEAENQSEVSAVVRGKYLGVCAVP